MKKSKYTLPFVNNGKPFTLSKWTVRKHEEVLKETAKYEKELTEKALDKKYRNILILKGLHEVDKTVTEDDLLDLHPEEQIALFTAVYLQGRRSILVEDKANFQKKKSQKPKE